MSIEVIDNVIQVAVMSVSSIAAAVLFLRHRTRRLFIFFLAYACLAMGTLYYVLSLAITGDVPQVFYVSEISWIASWSFLLSVQLVRTEGMQIYFSVLPALCLALTSGMVLFGRMMGPSLLVSGTFTAVMGFLMYLSVFRISSGRTGRLTDIWFILCVVLQMGVYISVGTHLI